MLQDFLILFAPIITVILALLLSFWIADKDGPVQENELNK